MGNWKHKEAVPAPAATLLTIYHRIVDEGAARVNYRAWKSRANNLIVLV